MPTERLISKIYGNPMSWVIILSHNKHHITTGKDPPKISDRSNHLSFHHNNPFQDNKFSHLQQAHLMEGKEAITMTLTRNSTQQQVININLTLALHSMEDILLLSLRSITIINNHLNSNNSHKYNKFGGLRNSLHNLWRCRVF